MEKIFVSPIFLSCYDAAGAFASFDTTGSDTRLGLPLPKALLRKILVQVYRGNYKWMNQISQSNGMSAFEQRMSGNPLYTSLVAPNHH